MSFMLSVIQLMVVYNETEKTLPHIQLSILNTFCILSLSLSLNVWVCACVHPSPSSLHGCSSLPCSNIRPCRHLGPVVWPLRGGNRLATGPDYFLRSPELNSVYAINQLHAVWSQVNHAINPVHKGLFTKVHTPTNTHYPPHFNHQPSKATATCRPTFSKILIGRVQPLQHGNMKQGWHLVAVMLQWHGLSHASNK